VRERLPKFDIERAVVTVVHPAKPGHNQTALFIDMFSSDASQLPVILSQKRR